MPKRRVTVIIRANMEVEEGQDNRELAKSIKEHGLGPEDAVSIAKVSVHPARSNLKLHRPLSKIELSRHAAKKKCRPGGRQQPKGTQPHVDILPDKPAWKPIPAPDRLLSDVRLAATLGVKPRTDILDMRCPKCNSSRMAKEQLLKCPECGYEGNCVDVNAPGEVEEPKAVPEPAEVQEAVLLEEEEARISSAIDKFRAKRQMNGKEVIKDGGQT